MPQRVGRNVRRKIAKIGDARITNLGEEVGTLNDANETLMKRGRMNGEGRMTSRRFPESLHLDFLAFRARLFAFSNARIEDSAEALEKFDARCFEMPASGFRRAETPHGLAQDWANALA